MNTPIPHTYHEELPKRVLLIYNSSESTGDLQIIEEIQPVVRDISCGDSHVLVITDEGGAYSWGCGDSGKCGHGISEGVEVRPKKLESSWINKFLYLNAGDELSLAVAMVDEGCLSATKRFAKEVRNHNPGKIGKVAQLLE